MGIASSALLSQQKGDSQSLHCYFKQMKMDELVKNIITPEEVTHFQIRETQDFPGIKIFVKKGRLNPKVYLTVSPLAMEQWTI